ncbi:hypothetical protein L6452_23281 [Arctium lappa]|uniref:Uncharacterized protein n=1 Tax=Arctium lappa TaxID=4217 RepID=A0ACB9B2I2_ARCLA|nr:hypothetical protein L6452_23281 [Arctium lappa]
MTRSTTSRNDEIEARLATMEENYNNISQQLTTLIRLQEEARRSNGEETSVDGERRTRHDDRPLQHGSFLAIKGRRLEMPVFNGTDPDSWIVRAERYFSLNRLNNEEKMEVALISLEDDALKWHQWEDKRRPITRWEELKALLLSQFHTVGEGSLCEQFLAVKQTTTVMEYKRRFITMAAPLEGISEEVYVSQFINGLLPEIRAEVRLLSPNGLNKAMDVACMVEERNKAVNPFKSYKANTFVKKTGDVNLEDKGDSKPSVNKGGVEFRKLSDKELQLRRAQGLCYRCDEKYSPGHHCKKKELSVMVVQEEEGSEDHTELTNMDQKMDVAVSLNSVIGFVTPKTMKLEGMVEDQKVVILIDSGAFHNFISSTLVEKLELPVNHTGGYDISLGAGGGLKGRGICKGVRVWMQGIEIYEDFLPLELCNSDIILGIQWLQSLGTMQVNWSTQMMKFQLGNEQVKLKGDESLGRTLVSLKSMIKTIKQEGQGVIIELGQMDMQMKSSHECPEAIRTIVNKFVDVFKEPQGLPPVRGNEHKIELKIGVQPINVRPYRYPQYQKNEIEKLVKEMLKAGIIKHSRSSFSSPVLLVKKRTEIGVFA